MDVVGGFVGRVESALTKQRMQLALTGFLQVIFVSMNTVFISQGQIAVMVITSFLISFLWTGNVKKVAFGDKMDRIIYALGACVGCGIGYFMASAWMTYCVPGVA